MDFLNKLYTKAIFSEASELNVTAYDLGEGMIGARLEASVVDRLPTATGTVGSLAIVVPVTVSISILKTSTAFAEYSKRILSNGYIGGTMTAYSDTNTPYVIKDVSLDIQEIPNMNGTEPAVEFQIKGNLEVNSDALKV